MVKQQSEEQISCKQRRFFVRYTPDKELNSQKTSCKYQENNQHTKDQANIRSPGFGSVIRLFVFTIDESEAPGM